MSSPDPKSAGQTESLQDLAKRAATIARNTHLRAINLKKIEAEILPGGEIPQDVEAQVHTNYAIEHGIAPDDGHQVLLVVVKLDARVDAGRPVVKVSATLVAIYDLNDGMPKDAEKDISAFASTNSMVHVWPYFRELIQSTVWRMGMPPFPLPLFRVGGEPGNPGANLPTK